MIKRYQFELLTFVEANGPFEYIHRNISDNLCISETQLKKIADDFLNDGLLKLDNNLLSITDKGLEALEPYRVKTAVILAAGFGQRMMPATADRPKPMVTVNGQRIIDTLLDALVAVGITDISLVRGYKKEKFDEIIEKYPFVRLIDNDDYDKTNNISSAMLLLDKLNGCYLCEADLYISNPSIITKYQYYSNILGLGLSKLMTGHSK